MPHRLPTTTRTSIDIRDAKVTLGLVTHDAGGSPRATRPSPTPRTGSRRPEAAAVETTAPGEERPQPVRAGVLGGLLGGTVAACLTGAALISTGRLWTGSSTAVLGIIFVVPFLAARAGLAGGLFGVHPLRARPEPRPRTRRSASSIARCG